mmetsp:Transcript_42960/g.90246  ORF Transcript_42960/g.90246 Transcript_42960/m.90246 type:complete len:925 (+) Transcript_42960:227-3001(+)
MCPPAYASEALKSRPRSDSTLDAYSPASRNEPGDGNWKVIQATNDRDTGASAPPLTVHLTPRFFVLVTILASAFAFSMGTMSRLILLSKMGLHPSSPSFHDLALLPINDTSNGVTQLPSPTVIQGKEVPFTTYTTKIFPQDSASTSHTVHLDRAYSLNLHAKEDVDEEYNNQQEQKASKDREDDADDLHLPAGQHLLVDMKNVDSSFLNSEVRLSRAMIDLINESKLTLLSYHCHTLVPMGVSCAGVLLESHVAFHTWPLEGSIVMDLFTCGAEPLIPVLPMIKNLFGIPSQDLVLGEEPSEPIMQWSHKLRGFREGFAPNYKRHENPLEHDLGLMLTRLDLDKKVPVVSEETDFQHVDVYEVIDPTISSLVSHDRSLSHDGSYESLNPDSFRSDKILFLDGVQQSSLFGDAAYHEALVHPSMITHPHPKRVAIIGGGEGATLREVLKHNTVEEVVMVEIDEELVSLMKTYLPEWSDCTDIAGSDADSCFDDSRATMVYQDAFKWFIDRFGNGESKEEKFDVIIMDALDPDQFVEIVGNLYKDNHFVDALYNGLSEKGVFAIQIGETETTSDPGDDTGPDQDTANMMRALQSVGFQSMHNYDEGHSHFQAPWSYLVCLKDSKSRASWYRTAPEIEIELHQRLHSTESGAPALRFFDGSTMVDYQTPPKAAETTYCRKEDEPWECDEYLGIDPEFVNAPISHLEARKSTLGEHAGRGLFAAQDIPMHSTLDLSGSVKAFYFLPLTLSVLEDFYEWADVNYDEYAYVEDELSSVYTFAYGYGYVATLLGEKHVTVDSGILSFCNHGCNGTFSYGEEESLGFTEMNVDLDHAPEALLNKISIVYSPVFERHLRQILAVGDYTLRDIHQGEEITCDYLSFVGDPVEWEEDVTGLRAQCLGETRGDIQEYEFETNADEPVFDNFATECA